MEKVLIKNRFIEVGIKFIPSKTIFRGLGILSLALVATGISVFGAIAVSEIFEKIIH